MCNRPPKSARQRPSYSPPRNQIPAIELSVAQNEDALATLLGKPPRSFDIGPDLPAGALPPAVPPGVPSVLIERRPDIRLAEQQLVAANANIGVARADQAAALYQRTILVALREVSDALAAYDRNGAEVRGNRERVAVASDYLKLADLRFRAGVISYLEVLDAQRQLFPAQLDLNASEVNQRLAAVQLYRALGGGWNPSAG